MTHDLEQDRHHGLRSVAGAHRSTTAVAGLAGMAALALALTGCGTSTAAAPATSSATPTAASTASGPATPTAATVATSSPAPTPAGLDDVAEISGQTVVLVSARTGATVRTLVSSTTLRAGSATLDASGRYAYYVDEQGAARVPVAGGAAVRLPVPTSVDGTGGFEVQAVVPAPTDGTLLEEIGFADDARPVETVAIDVATHHVTDLGAGEATGWAPDGRTAYVTTVKTTAAATSAQVAAFTVTVTGVSLAEPSRRTVVRSIASSSPGDDGACGGASTATAVSPTGVVGWGLNGCSTQVAGRLTYGFVDVPAGTSFAGVDLPADDAGWDAIDLEYSPAGTAVLQLSHQDCQGGEPLVTGRRSPTCRAGAAPAEPEPVPCSGQAGHAGGVRRLLVTGTAVAAAVVIAASIATIADRAGNSATTSADVSATPSTGSLIPSPLATAPQPGSSGSTPLPSATDQEASGSPESVTSAYYAALHAQDAATAFGLLCPQQQAEGEKAFAASVVQDQQTGTGIVAFVRTGDATVDDAAATVPGHVQLEDGRSVAIHVLLVQDGSAWEVCSSDLGGVLPGPGSSSASASSSSAAV